MEWMDVNECQMDGDAALRLWKDDPGLSACVLQGLHTGHSASLCVLMDTYGADAVCTLARFCL